MQYLITGITGFVGPHLAELLVKDGHTVFGLVRGSNGREVDIRDTLGDEVYSEITFLYGDLTHPNAIDMVFSKHAFDGVFHLAAQSHPPTSFEDPSGTFFTNVNGTIYLINAIERYMPECRFMFCSTSEVYGAVPEEQGKITEAFPLAPINPYAVSKAAADLYVRERAKTKNSPFFVTRAFSHTGPRRGRIFSISSDAYQIMRIKKGFQESVIKVGNLDSKRTVMDVRDCVRGYYMVMQKLTPGEAYNLGGDEVHPMRYFLERLISLAGLEGAVKLEPDPKLFRPIDIPCQIPDSTKCRQLTGWQLTIDLDTTLSDLLGYWDRKIR